MSLAWLGAEVIKIERPKTGELGRYSIADPGVDSVGFIIMNANKKSITLNLKSPEGKEILEKLIKKADVFIENMGPGSIDRLGFDYDTVNKLNPMIIYAQIKGFGQDGPWADFPAFNPIAQAVGGMTSITGEADGPPMQCGANIADSGAGYFTALGIVSALYQRDKEGKGQRVEVSMQDTTIAFCRAAWEQQLRNNEPAPRVGNGMPLEPVAPAGMYRCKPLGRNDYIHIYASRHPGSKQWEILLNAIGRTDMLGDPRLATPRSRYDHREEIDAAIEAWTTTKTKIEAMEILSKAGVPAGASLDTAEISQDAYLQKRGMMAKVSHDEHGELIIPGFPVKLSDSQVTVKCSPKLGESNEEVYKDMLGISEEAFNDYLDKGII